ncbi:LOW QUALITY PROTEIN: hypothetical protein CVT25_011761 [Psilocybe cyanescens]|uniref:Uncharacterized protein n=1 Tax=Psilocybe cyanescens TaxID=93625 RepID=A0A409W1K2_PSICY|nr:LOW QUALITY PROTEIN: hypothetical protein CVT25_011761 [Psilocybe cyanescens]
MHTSASSFPSSPPPSPLTGAAGPSPSRRHPNMNQYHYEDSHRTRRQSTTKSKHTYDEYGLQQAAVLADGLDGNECGWLWRYHCLSTSLEAPATASAISVSASSSRTSHPQPLEASVLIVFAELEYGAPLASARESTRHRLLSLSASTSSNCRRRGGQVGSERDSDSVGRSVQDGLNAVYNEPAAAAQEFDANGVISAESPSNPNLKYRNHLYLHSHIHIHNCIPLLLPTPTPPPIRTPFHITFAVTLTAQEREEVVVLPHGQRARSNLRCMQQRLYPPPRVILHLPRHLKLLLLRERLLLLPYSCSRHQTNISVCRRGWAKYGDGEGDAAVITRPTAHLRLAAWSLHSLWIWGGGIDILPSSPSSSSPPSSAPYIALTAATAASSSWSTLLPLPFPTTTTIAPKSYSASGSSSKHTGQSIDASKSKSNAGGKPNSRSKPKSKSTRSWFYSPPATPPALPPPGYATLELEGSVDGGEKGQGDSV